MSLEDLKGLPEVSALAEALKGGREVDVFEVGGDEFLSIPNEDGSRTVEDIRTYKDQYLENPRYRSGKVRLETQGSFIDLVNRFKMDNSVIFACRSSTQLEAIFDYNEGPEGKPHFRRHRAVYPCPLSEEWLAWNGAQGRWMDQESFAEFLEDRLIDVADPGTMGERAKLIQEKLGGLPLASPNKLLELSRGLSVRVGRDISNHTNTGTGEVEMVFAESHADKNGAALTVPGLFLINIPVFDAGAQYQITVRLRYRIRGASVMWQVQLQQPQVMLDHAFSGVVETTEEATELPIFFGIDG